jgi:hypothetical protein
MAESSGRTDVVNSIGCVGLWQINQPVHVKAHPTWTVKWLQDPVNNAKAAKVIYASQGWAAWEAYTGPDGRGSDGPWRRYYKGSSTATGADWRDPFGLWPEDAGEPPKGFLDEWFGDEPTDEFGNPVTGLEDVATALGTVAEGVQKTATWLGNPRNWVRVGYVTGGAVLVALGLSIVARPLVQGTPVGRVATMAGKAARAASKGRKKPAAAKPPAKSRATEGQGDD